MVNSADPDEMLHYAAFHRGLHCLPKYPFAAILNEKLIFLFQNHNIMLYVLKKNISKIKIEKVQ